MTYIYFSQKVLVDKLRHRSEYWRKKLDGYKASGDSDDEQSAENADDPVVASLKYAITHTVFILIEPPNGSPWACIRIGLLLEIEKGRK